MQTPTESQAIRQAQGESKPAEKIERPKFDAVELWKSSRPAEREKANQWYFDSSGEAGSDRMRLQSKYRVSEEDILKANPQLKGKFDPDQKDQKLFLRHPTTGEVDGGWSIESRDGDGKYTLSRQYRMDVQSKKDHGSLIESTSGVPDSFLKSLEKKVNELPPNVLKSLSRHGYKIVAAPTIADAMPGLKKLTPRGWPSDTTFDNSDGTHDDVSKRIIAPMRVLTEQGWEPVTRENVVTHQIGHALDFAHGFLSSKKEFVDAYEKDMAAITDKKHPIVQYFSQKNGVGRQETFASIFGLLTTGPENESDRRFFEKNFPNVIGVVRKQIKELN